MEQATISGVRRLLASRELHPHRGLGQNFLIDKNVLQKIVTAAEIERADTVLEIGAGLGALTGFLSQAAREVIAVEIDKKLIPLLQDILSAYENVTLLNGDILELDWDRDIFPLMGEKSGKIVVCANLPYYITSPIIFKILEHKSRVKSAVLMVQKEVADRLAAEPGTKDYGLLTVMVSRRASVRQLLRVSRSCFYPVPDVDSTVVVIEPLDQTSDRVSDEAVFQRLVRAAFQSRRKTMHNVLWRSGLVNKEDASPFLESLGIEPQRRGETLSVREFSSIANAISMIGPAGEDPVS